MQYNIQYHIIFCLGYNFISCDNVNKSDSNADSTLTIVIADDSLKKGKNYFLKGHKFLTRWYYKNSLCGETHYSDKDSFELRREIYDNNIYAYEGIHFRNYPYGLATWYYKNGQMREQGYRFKDKKLGVWNEWDENGKVASTTDF